MNIIKRINIFGTLWWALLVIFLFAGLLTLGLLYAIDVTTFKWDKGFDLKGEVVKQSYLYQLDSSVLDLSNACFIYKKSNIRLCSEIIIEDNKPLRVVVRNTTSNKEYPIAISKFNFFTGRKTHLGGGDVQQSIFQLGAFIQKLEDNEEREIEAKSGMRWLQAVIDVLKTSNRMSMRLMGWVQILIYSFSMIAIALMIIDISFVLKNEGILSSLLFLNDRNEYITLDEIQELKNEIQDKRKNFSFHNEYEPPIIYDTLEPSLDLLRTYEGEINRGEFLSSVDTICNSVKEKLERRFQVLRYFVMTIPSLGFIGTVIGISDALGLTSRLTGDSPNYERVFANESLGQSLNVAFDTTLVGLIASILLSFFLDWLESWELSFVIKVKEKVINRLSYIKRIS